MTEPIVISLRPVVTRKGEKIPTTLRQSVWDGKEEYVVTFGPNIHHEWPIASLFRFVLVGGNEDFLNLDDEFPSQDVYIAPGEIRALVRQVMEHRTVAGKLFDVSVEARVEVKEPRPADDGSWLFGDIVPDLVPAVVDGVSK